MGLLYHIAVPVGSTWTDKEGNERPNTMVVGRVIETAKGSKMAILDGLPFSAFAKGEPLVMYFNEPKQREGGDEKPRSKPSGRDANRDTSDKLDDDIPF